MLLIKAYPCSLPKGITLRWLRSPCLEAQGDYTPPKTGEVLHKACSLASRLKRPCVIKYAPMLPLGSYQARFHMKPHFYETPSHSPSAPHPYSRETDIRKLLSRSVMSNSLQPHGLQHARLPCPSLSPRVCSNHACWVSDAIKINEVIKIKPWGREQGGEGWRIDLKTYQWELSGTLEHQAAVPTPKHTTPLFLINRSWLHLRVKSPLLLSISPEARDGRVSQSGQWDVSRSLRADCLFLPN